MVSFIIAQVCGVINIITTTIGIFKKEKAQTMLWFTFSNLAILATYILLGRYLASLLILGTTLRTFVYYLYSYRNKNIPTFVYVFVNIYLISLSIILWKDYYDLILIANLLMVSYTTWKNKMRDLRLGYLLSALFLLTYDICVGAYAAAVSDIILGITYLLAIYRYDIRSSIEDVIMDFYQTIAPAYNTTITTYPNYNYVHSDIVDDAYNNFCYVPNVDNFQSVCSNVIDVMSHDKLTPAIYMPSIKYENIHKIYEIMQTHELLYHDVWMQLRSGQNTRYKHCMLPEVTFHHFDDNKKDEIIDVFDKGFVHTLNNNTYKYSEKYITKYQQTLDSTHLKEINMHPYYASLNGEVIAVLFMYRKNYNSYLCQITTLKKYRRKGVASTLMRYAIQEERKQGMSEFYLITEKYTYLENFYMKNNFEEIAQGYCVGANIKK